MTPDELIQSYFEGTLTPESEKQLRAWLESDPSHLEEFTEQLDVHASLWEEYISPAGATSPEPLPVPSTARPRRRIGTARTVGAGKRNPYLVPVLAAAAALVAVTAMVLFSGGEERGPKPGKIVSRPESPRPIPPVVEPERPRPKEPPPAAPKKDPVAPPLEPPPPRPEIPKEPPKVVPPPPVEPEPPKPPKQETAVTVAKIDRIEGEAFLLSKRGRLPLKGGEDILASEGIETVGVRSLAVVMYPDRTRLEMGGDTALEEFSAPGMRLALARGSVLAEVKKQPADRPMSFVTPHGEATVLGTSLRLSVDAGERGSTRLEVKEGKVRLTRLADQKAVEVVSGQYAVATAGVELVARLMRVSSGLQALYLFTEGQGTEVHDTSGAGAPLDLRIRKLAAAAWRSPGLSIEGRTYVASPGPAIKIVEACKKSRELTLELWIKPAKPSLDSEGCLFALSKEDRLRNVTFQQGDRSDSLNLYAVFLRTTGTDAGGAPALFSAKGSVEPRLTHLAFVHAASGAEKLYIDGVERGARARAGDFSVWSESFRLCLATEGPDTDDERPWLGEYRLVAVYSRALTLDEVGRNHKSGAP